MRVTKAGFTDIEGRFEFLKCCQLLTSTRPCWCRNVEIYCIYPDSNQCSYWLLLLDCEKRNDLLFIARLTLNTIRVLDRLVRADTAAASNWLFCSTSTKVNSLRKVSLPLSFQGMKSCDREKLIFYTRRRNSDKTDKIIKTLQLTLLPKSKFSLYSLYDFTQDN